jgi:hypothetical protein
MLEVLYQKTGEVPASGPPIDGVRRGRIGGKELSQDLALIHALPSALHQGRKGLCILRTVPVKTLHRSHCPFLLWALIKP